MSKMHEGALISTIFSIFLERKDRATVIFTDDEEDKLEARVYSIDRVDGSDEKLYQIDFAIILETVNKHIDPVRETISTNYTISDLVAFCYGLTARLNVLVKLSLKDGIDVPWPEKQSG